MKRSIKALSGTLLLLCLLIPGIAIAESTSGTYANEPSKAQLPGWLEQGKIRFARLDGGPIEVQKVKRSSWGEQFTPHDTEVLGNLYGKYGDQMVALLKQAHVNFVWVTYSVGFSWKDETAQRAAAREILRKLHANGIHVAAYMCAVSLFWQSMFADDPQSVGWVMFDPDGVPYRYSGGRDSLRFIADVRNPGWVAYQEKRVGALVDDGFDAIFFDNTAPAAWASNQSMARFLAQIREFVRNRKHSNIPVFSNFGLTPSRAALNHYVNFTYDESWQQPGVWGTAWDVSNIRRDRLLHGILPSRRPIVTEYSIFHSGNRSTMFLSAHSLKLGIAEAAAYGTAYTWDSEGPWDTALIDGEKKALESWSAIGQYNGFLKNHPELYVGAADVAPLLVVVPDADWDHDGFAWDDGTGAAFCDFLSKHSILYAVMPASYLAEGKIRSYSGVVIPSYSALTAPQQKLIRSYQAGGGKVYAFARVSDLHGLKCERTSPDLAEHLAGHPNADREILAKLSSLTPEATNIELTGAQHVLANVTTLGQSKGIVIHLLNYDAQRATQVHLTLHLGERFRHLIGRQVTVDSPDDRTSGSLENIRWRGAVLQGTLPTLETYAVIWVH